MVTLFIASAARWLCALIAVPRRPLPGQEAAELVYARLLGRQQRLVLLAVTVTLAAVLVVILGLPSRMGATTPPSDRICIGAQACYVARADGRWDWVEPGSDGRWAVRGVVDAPVVADPTRGYG